jgi:pyruvate/2-oxoglutarate dehydrogenase complex dihydrolipoamide dehydrogenase (E3) component
VARKGVTQRLLVCVVEGGAKHCAADALELDRLPHHLVVIGGGYVGLELAQAYRRFGSRVTIIETGPQLAGREDPDVAAAPGILRDKASRFISAPGSRCARVVRSDCQPPVTCTLGRQTIEGSDILVAAGRANTQGIGLDLAGVALDARGYIAVNDRLLDARAATSIAASPTAL